MNIVYYITNKNNGKRYIGSTGYPKGRIERHFNELEKGMHHCLPLQKDFTDRNDFDVTYIVLDTREEAYVLEDELLKKLSDIEPGIYNVGLSARGGDNLTRNPNRDLIILNIKHTLRQTLDMMSEEERKYKYGRNGEVNGMYGKTHTDSVRQYISEINKGRVPPNKGIPMSDKRYDEHMSYVRSRDINGEANPFHGKKHTEESKLKMRNANLGKLPINCKAIQINGITYQSLADASRDLSIPVPTIHWRVKSNNPKYVDWFSINLNAQRLTGDTV